MLLSHDELIAELPKLAELNARERKKLNDSRRRAQLDLWEANDHTETGEYYAPYATIECLDLCIHHVLIWTFQ